MPGYIELLPIFLYGLLGLATAAACLSIKERRPKGRWALVGTFWAITVFWPFTLGWMLQKYSIYGTLGRSEYLKEQDHGRSDPSRLS